MMPQPERPSPNEKPEPLRFPQEPAQEPEEVHPPGYPHIDLPLPPPTELPGSTPERPGVPPEL